MGNLVMLLLLLPLLLLFEKLFLSTNDTDELTNSSMKIRTQSHMSNLKILV